MSFGWSATDIANLAQLAWRTVQNTRKACGEHDDLTRDCFSLHLVLHRLEKEVSRPDSPLYKEVGLDTNGQEIEIIASDCRKVLRALNSICQKYNDLSDAERSVRKLWQQVGKFGAVILSSGPSGILRPGLMLDAYPGMAMLTPNSH